ncbi:uncharacterized protein LOC135337750 isoform X4 [Halichondria panicea]|uniref:uncharacterized protein LOC135337750 isoform X4 n=1 Tax=Halichondria panicea TaxID=6063 RepID=UPI00312B723E
MVTVRLEGDLVTPLCVCARNHTLGILVKPVITATTATQSTVDTQLVTGMEFHKFYFDHHFHDHTQGSDVGGLRRLLCLHPPHPNSRQGRRGSLSEYSRDQDLAGYWKYVHSHCSAGGANPARSPDTPSDQ